MRISLDFTVPLSTEFLGGFNTPVKTALDKWRSNVRAQYFRDYKTTTRRKGLRTLYAGRASHTKGFATGVGIEFSLFVDPKKLKGLTSRGRTLRQGQWAGIAHMAEFGETRSGSKQIFPRKGRLLAIPNENERDVLSRPSPRSWTGRWIESSKPDLWLFVEDRQQGKRGARRHKRRKLATSTQPRKIRQPRVGRERLDSRVLFFGKTSVNVREATPFYRPALGGSFGTGTGDMMDLRNPTIHPRSHAMRKLRFQLNKYVGTRL